MQMMNPLKFLKYILLIVNTHSNPHAEYTVNFIVQVSGGVAHNSLWFTFEKWLQSSWLEFVHIHPHSYGCNWSSYSIFLHGNLPKEVRFYQTSGHRILPLTLQTWVVQIGVNRGYIRILM